MTKLRCVVDYENVKYTTQYNQNIGRKKFWIWVERQVLQQRMFTWHALCTAMNDTAWATHIIVSQYQFGKRASVLRHAHSHHAAILCHDGCNTCRMTATCDVSSMAQDTIEWTSRKLYNYLSWKCSVLISPLTASTMPGCIGGSKKPCLG